MPDPLTPLIVNGMTTLLQQSLTDLVAGDFLHIGILTGTEPNKGQKAMLQIKLTQIDIDGIHAALAPAAASPGTPP